MYNYKHKSILEYQALLDHKEVLSYFMITFIVDSNSLLWCNLLASLVVKSP